MSWFGFLEAHAPLLVILFPLCGGLLCPFLSKIHGTWGKRVVMVCLFLSVVLSIWQLVLVHEQGVLHYWLGNWRPPYGIELAIDGVNGLVVALVSVISWLTALYSSPFEVVSKGSKGWVRTAGYYSILAFLSVGLLGMASAGDAFNLYVFMEITALSGYGLIAIGEEKGPIAAFRYLLTGTIGASMYLLGVGFLYAATGTLNMTDLSIRLETLGDSPLVILAAACLVVGFGIKMALFPLHGWQPAAHSYAHPAADPMIAGIMIKVPAYGMLRFFFYIFYENSPVMELFFQAIGIMGALGILFGSLKALRYSAYNKILAYSSIGQVGYIAMGFAIGNIYGLMGAVLHILSHAFMKTGLFYTSGALKYKYGIHEITSFGQIYKDMPTTATAMVVCALSMVGLPPFAGFFSKWYLAMGAIENGQYLYVAILILSSLLSAIYFFRIFEELFMGKRIEERKKDGPLPWQMLLPLGAVAAAVIGLGLGNSSLVSELLKPTLLEVFLV
ncbi:MAG: NADH/ubiquinone/plastoquinone (complex I) [Firmicutes bacterium]|nr:NADH/ubiquinone/plastoquinone (complex I) [Bacillota bacterium]